MRGIEAAAEASPPHGLRVTRLASVWGSFVMPSGPVSYGVLRIGVTRFPMPPGHLVRPEAAVSGPGGARRPGADIR